MGWLANLLSFTRTDRDGVKVSESKVDSGGLAIITADHYSAPGDDAQPLPNDSVAVMPTQASGSGVCVAYLDTVSEPKAQPGEKRIYGRNAEGELTAEVWIKADTSVLMANANGSIQLNTDGSVNINGVTIGTDGSISTGSTITADGEIEGAGVALSQHLHEPGTYNVSGAAVAGVSGNPVVTP